jgi:hypothetical protein
MKMRCGSALIIGWLGRHPGTIESAQDLSGGAGLQHACGVKTLDKPCVEKPLGPVRSAWPRELLQKEPKIRVVSATWAIHRWSFSHQLCGVFEGLKASEPRLKFFPCLAIRLCPFVLPFGPCLSSLCHRSALVLGVAFARLTVCRSAAEAPPSRRFHFTPCLETILETITSKL